MLRHVLTATFNIVFYEFTQCFDEKFTGSSYF